MAKFLDKLITLGGVFLLCLIWAGYFVPRESRIAVSFVLAVAVCGLLFTFLGRKKAGKLTKLELLHMEEIINQLAFSDLPYNVSFFADALSKKYRVTKHKNHFLVHSGNTKTAVFPFMKLIRLTSADLSEIYTSAAKYKSARLLILSIEGATKSAADTAGMLSDRKITILGKTDVYKMLNELDAFPPVRLTVKKKRRKLADLGRAALSPQKARRYLLIGVFMLITSFFVRMSVYYIAAASLVTVLAIAARFDVLRLVTERKRAAEDA